MKKATVIVINISGNRTKYVKKANQFIFNWYKIPKNIHAKLLSKL